VHLGKALKNVKAEQQASASYDVQMLELPGNTQRRLPRVACFGDLSSRWSIMEPNTGTEFARPAPK
jgi:hypothetical protein